MTRDAAATDPALRQLVEDDDQRRYLTQQALVDLITSGDSPRPGRDRDHAVATFFAMVNSHCYQLLARHLGWSLADWQQWLTSVLGRELLDTSQPARRTPESGDTAQ